MDNISKLVSIPVQSPALSDMVFAAQVQAGQSKIYSNIAHSPVVEPKIAQSPVAQPKIFQPELPESEFLNLSFDQLSQVAVRASRSNQMQTQMQTKEALEVKSQENFLEMPLEKLIRLPVRLATLGKNDKDKELKNAEEVTSNPTSINFQSIPVFSKQALQSVTSYNTNLEDTSTTNTTTDTTSITTTTTTTTTVPPIVPPTVIPILPVPLLVVQFLGVANNGSSNISVLIRNSDGTFGAANNFFTGGSPQNLVIGDLNKDGILDVVVANFGSNTINILLGTGLGTFATPIDYPLPSPVDIALGDFNGDNILDLAVANYSDTISIFLGTGTGSFTAPMAFSVGISAVSYGLTTGDFNGDGILDLAVTDFPNQSINVLLGLGGGAFGAPTIFSIGINSANVVTGDFNGDGILDLAVTSSNDQLTAILLGTGTGDFVPLTTLSGGALPLGIAIGDFNKDGFLDLAVANIISNDVSIFLGLGNGFFNAALNFGVGIGPQDVAVGDFNRDGNLDIVTANAGDGSISILFGNGNGTFQGPINYAAGSSPSGVAVGFLPAGVSGSPINLALVNPTKMNEMLTLTIDDIPLGWALNEGINNLDGSWTVQTSNPELLTITTAPDFVGARVLTVDMSWISINGEIEHSYIKNNIEAYALDSAIFALPNDNLTGSDNADTFVITKSNRVVQDNIFNFDTKLDKIDLIGFKTVYDFSDLLIKNDVYGNALIHLGEDNQSIVLHNMNTLEITQSNFLFNVTPYTLNSGIIDIGGGSIMPFNGVFENNGTVQVNGTLRVQGDITGFGKIILGSSGILEVQGNLSQDISFEQPNGLIISDYINLNLAKMTSITLPILLEYNQNIE